MEEIYMASLRWFYHLNIDTVDRAVLNSTVAPTARSVQDLNLGDRDIMDMEMITTFNARERPLEDWKRLCQDAHPGLKLRRSFKPAGSIMSIMEFVLEE
ncbi:hypothetical protein BO78DRAFT_429259 [Aspergillus sclerotiicarbonarius CBS 121057]|uniref:Uncharacterized protein n=1 Tax=Aspergillus sclerotiicarbonarius (strain CBS 121057 / IBT 28362) TaxID=1448318 RepID=A0A319EH30_ASPSB|nr:hypothetical protein BO78DRAFT_429259 [Aspergillus sclerotiicarbonarius CBS 121057]